MILFCRTIEADRIVFQSESIVVAEMFEKLFAGVFKDSSLMERSERIRKSGATLYSFEINGAEKTKKILSRYHISPEKRSIDSELIVNNSHGEFAAGIFLACGSVNDPSKEYHLEFTVPEETLAKELKKMLSGIGVNAKSVLRRGQHIVYVKESESIEDTLTFIGAQQCTLELMNVKIFKDVRNKANRIANCDAANIDKVVNAALRQIEDIKLIAETTGFDELSEELREVAELRLSNTDMSLQEIGESLSVPISRSGVNHRFKKIAKIAEEIRAGRVKKNEGR